MEFIEKREKENKAMLAANTPIYGAVTYDRAAETILK